MNTEDESSQDLTLERPASGTSNRNESWAALDVDLGASSHQGHVRENNEDHYLLMRFGRSLENLSSNLDQQMLAHSYSLVGYGMLVADGMGGMAAGELASGLALAKLVELLVDTPDWILALKREEDVSIVLQRMTQRFLQIDQALREKAEWDTTLRGMGTTLTVAATLGSDLVLGHVGDSRAYLLRGSNLQQLTIDHTLAQALIDAGVANRDDPATRSMRHVLTAAIGALGKRIEPQVQCVKLCDRDHLLLCTDGLTDMVDDKTIYTVLLEADSAQEACETLVDLALKAGGLDNITVVGARFVAPPLQVSR